MSPRDRELPPLADRPDDELLLPDEVMAYLRLESSPRTLGIWRTATPRQGPPFVRLGGSTKGPVRYPAGDLRAYIAERTARPSQAV